MLKKGSLYQIFHAHMFALRLVWQIDKKRILFEFLNSFCGACEYLVYGAVFTQIVLDMAERKAEFSRMMIFLWIAFLPRVVSHLYSSWYARYKGPVSDVYFYETLNRMLYQKACQADMACFEDSGFYNEYMMAVREAKKRVPEMLHDFCEMTVCFLAALFGFYMIYRIDRFALLFMIFPILGNFVFNGMLNRRIFEKERESVVFARIADYVNRTIHFADYAKEIRLTNVFSLLRQQYGQSVQSRHQIIDRYAFKNIVLFGCFQYFTFTLLYNGAVLYAGYRTLAVGSMALSQMAVFQNFMRSNSWNFLYSAEAAMENVKNSMYIRQIESFLNYVPKVPEDADGRIPELPVVSIEFSHVWFGYQKDRAVLKDVSFQLKAKEHAAVVGFNGSGKSTMMKLLLRMYDPDKGHIYVNGVDIRDYQLRAYRGLFAAAFQDGKIFADTVAENILMGAHTTPKQDHAKIWEALALAGIADEVRAWKGQEQAVLTREFSGEGLVLSGGQSQKLIAARAFAKDCPVAVFDEPSSALDPLAEYGLFANILGYSKNRMLFFISHRLSSVRDADIVFFMENGRITERGNHQALMEQNGRYAELYRTQAKNYQACGGKRI